MIFFLLLGPYLQHMEVLDPSSICDLHHSLWQHWILNPLREARDRTHIFMGTRWIHNLLSHNGNSQNISCFKPLHFGIMC